VPSQSFVHVPVPGEGLTGPPGPLPELVNTASSLEPVADEATGEMSGFPPHAACLAPARARGDVCISSSVVLV
jgi:hypothetical protein